VRVRTSSRIKLCECGCGQTVKPGNRFIHGHNKPWKGRKRSERTKEKIRNTLKRKIEEGILKPPNTPKPRVKLRCDYCGNEIYKLERSIRRWNFCGLECYWKWLKGKSPRDIWDDKAEEIIKKRSEKLRGKVFTEERKRKISEALRGKTFSRERRERLSRAARRRWANPMERERKRVETIRAFRENPELRRRISESVRRVWMERKKAGVPYGHQGRKHTRETRIRLALIKTLQAIWRGAEIREYGAFWKIQRERALERDGYICQVCGSRESLIVHHMVPIRMGGTHSLDNLMTLCRSCHNRWEGKIDAIVWENTKLASVV